MEGVKPKRMPGLLMLPRNVLHIQAGVMNALHPSSMHGREPQSSTVVKKSRKVVG